MRQIDYKTRQAELLVPEIVELLSQIHELKGAQNSFLAAKPDALSHLLEIAKIESTAASNQIEGISTTDNRLKQIVLDKTQPKNRSERELAGYRDVLKVIHENYPYIPLKPSYILQLHKMLYEYSGKDYGGKFKIADNIISETDDRGNRKVRFVPVPAWETPDAIDKICIAFQEAVDGEKIDPLLVIPLWILDFLCVHPFSDGNGRMSRLLTLLFLYRADYQVGKYISIERLIERTKESYYEALIQSSYKWHEGGNDDLPFVRYMLGVILAAYREFSERANKFIGQNPSKPERVREILKASLSPMTKREIAEQNPDIAEITIQRALLNLVQEGVVMKIGGGRYTKYIWNREKR